MFADEAKAGALAKVALEDRPGIDVPKRSGILAGERLDALGQLAKRLGECVVVIGVTRVPGDDTVAWAGGCVGRLAKRLVGPELVRLQDAVADPAAARAFAGVRDVSCTTHRLTE